MIFLVQSGGVPHLHAQLNVSEISRATRPADYTSWWVAFEPSKGVGKVNINEIADLPIINFRASLGTKQVRISLRKCLDERQTCRCTLKHLLWHTSASYSLSSCDVSFARVKNICFLNIFLKRIRIDKTRKKWRGCVGSLQTVAAPTASWGEDAHHLAMSRVPCDLHQL